MLNYTLTSSCIPPSLLPVLHEVRSASVTHLPHDAEAKSLEWLAKARGLKSWVNSISPPLACSCGVLCHNGTYVTVPRCTRKKKNLEKFRAHVSLLRQTGRFAPWTCLWLLTASPPYLSFTVAVLPLHLCTLRSLPFKNQWEQQWTLLQGQGQDRIEACLSQEVLKHRQKQGGFYL